MFHIGASFVSLAPTYFISQSALTPLLLLSKSQSLTLGRDLGPPLRGGFVPLQGNIDFNYPFQLVASDISRATSFFISLQSSSHAHSAAPRFQTGPASLGSRWQAALWAAFFHLKANGNCKSSCRSVSKKSLDFFDTLSDILTCVKMSSTARESGGSPPPFHTIPPLLL